MKICGVDGCNGKHEAKGFCDPHYRRFAKYGDPQAGDTARGACLRGFEEVLKLSTDDCVKWQFGFSDTGYPIVSFNRKSMGAHRAVCERVHGLAPSPRHQASHSCGNRWCVNPRHIRWLTPIANGYERYLHQKNPKSSATSRLSISEVRAIKRQLAENHKIKPLARKFGVSPKAIRKIRDGVTWSWVQLD